MRKSVRPWLIGVGILPLALVLTGCFGGPALPGMGGGTGNDPTEDELVEDIVEGSGEGIDFEAGELPADFPVDAVPLVPGQVQSGISVSDGQAWIVTSLTDSEATADTATALLEQAGFTNDSVFAWENDEYLVVITASEQAEDGWLVGYQVQAQP